MSPQADQRVFVYGTLKRGGQYHSIMEEAGAVLFGTGKLVIPYPLILANYPCLLDQPHTAHRVKGEVYTLPSAQAWTKLDWLEGHPREYVRRPEDVEVGNTIVQAWTYFYQLENQLDPHLVPVAEFPIV